MKDSKLYADKIKKLHRSLKRTAAKVQPVTYEDPLEALTYGILCEHVTSSQAQAAQKRLTRHFVDLNDLRVARPDEIAESFGEDSKAVLDTAVRLTRVLTAVFNRAHALTLTAIKKLGKRPARQFVETLDGVSPFAVHYCMLTALQSHAIPVNDRMIEYLKAEGLIHPGSEAVGVEGFLSKLVPAREGYEFYVLLRAQSEAWRPSEKKAGAAMASAEAARKGLKKKQDQP